MPVTDYTIWIPSASVQNPTDQTVLCTSGPLSPGDWIFGVTGSCDVTVHYQIKAINVALLLGDRRPAAGDVDWLQPSQANLNVGEVVNVIIVGNPAATVQLTLYGLLLSDWRVRRFPR
jgi:hypothetical protein